jgi:hypothetical protein
LSEEPDNGGVCNDELYSKSNLGIILLLLRLLMSREVRAAFALQGNRHSHTPDDAKVHRCTRYSDAGRRQGALDDARLQLDDTRPGPGCSKRKIRGKPVSGPHANSLVDYGLECIARQEATLRHFNHGLRLSQTGIVVQELCAGYGCRDDGSWPALQGSYCGYHKGCSCGMEEEDADSGESEKV